MGAAHCRGALGRTASAQHAPPPTSLGRLRARPFLPGRATRRLSTPVYLVNDYPTHTAAARPYAGALPRNSTPLGACRTAPVVRARLRDRDRRNDGRGDRPGRRSHEGDLLLPL